MSNLLARWNRRVWMWLAIGAPFVAYVQVAYHGKVLL